MQHTHATELGLPIGEPVPDWQPRPRPLGAVLTGRTCRLEGLSRAHAADLFAADALDSDGRSWTYLPYGPFGTLAEYEGWVDAYAGKPDPMFYAVIDTASDRAVGVASYLRIDPANGSIEVGHIHFSPLLQRRAAATEAMYLMMKHAFDLGYRRYEWKCNALNRPSRAAAQRLGLSYEGLFRQAAVVRGRNRDTAWFAAIDSEWPALRAAFERWLAPSNFDAHGQQRAPLAASSAISLIIDPAL
jgi:RimJ/RimL family protein N-acetyltransferase